MEVVVNYGVEAYNTTGAKILSIDTEMWLIMATKYIDAKSAGVLLIPGISAINYKILVTPVTDTILYKMPLVSISGDTLSWSSPGTGGCAANIIVLGNG